MGQSSRAQYLLTNVVENIHRPSTDAASEASSFEPRGEGRLASRKRSLLKKTLLPNHARKKAETLRDATGPRAWTRPRSGAERSARRAACARAGNARVSPESPRGRERRSIRAHRAFPAPRGSRHARRHRNCRRRRRRGCERGKENHRGGVAIARAVVPLSCWLPRLSCAPRAASAPPRAPWRPPARAIPPRRPAGPRGPRPWRRAPRPRASCVGSKWAGKVSGAKVSAKRRLRGGSARAIAADARGKSREG